VNWYTDFIRTTDFVLRELGEGLPGAIAVLLRLAMLYLFFWYLYDFSVQLSPCYGVPVLLLSLFALILFGWRVARAVREFNLQKDQPGGSLGPYIYINLFPLAVVVFATWWKYPKDPFPAYGVTYFTQQCLKKLLGIT